MSQPRVLAIVLAGGEGKRLMPLTADRAKPAVPFGGDYRLIDFVLSNMANGGYLRVVVLTQYKSHSLDRHVTTTWRLSSLLENYVTTVPAQQRLGPHWFEGSGDAIFQSLNLLDDDRPDYVIVFGADHIYRMDPRQMVAQHVESGAGVTVAGIRQPISLADQFGVIEAAPDGRRVAAFREKPSDPVGLPDNPEEIFASMGNYVFTAQTLIDAVSSDAEDDGSRHDLGGNIIPKLVEAGEAQVYDFQDNAVPGTSERSCGYWRDVGTLDSFYDAHMDLLAADPLFELHNPLWPIYTSRTQAPGAKFVGGGTADGSVISAGCLLDGGRVSGSVLSPNVKVLDGAQVEGSVLMPNVTIGRGARVRNAILDKNVRVPDGARIGFDRVSDREHYTVSANGVTVLGKDAPVAS